MIHLLLLLVAAGVWALATAIWRLGTKVADATTQHVQTADDTSEDITRLVGAVRRLTYAINDLIHQRQETHP